MSYVPPHLRNQGGGAPPARAPPSNGGAGGGASKLEALMANLGGDRRGGGFGGDRGGGGFGGDRGGGGFGGDRGGGGGPPRDSGGPRRWDEGGSGGRGGSQTRNARLELDIFGEPPVETEEQKAGINFDKYDNIPIETSGKDCPPMVAEFSELNLPDVLMQNIALARYTRPTPIQKTTIPISATGRDLMACAQTGSGKTASFLIPMVTKLLRDPSPPPPSYGGRNSRSLPRSLILAPTRELASQIHNESRKFCYCTPLGTVVVYGGADIRDQLRQLERGADMVVATPGRLVDLLERGRLGLSDVLVLALDEADRMLDMGFEPQIRRIVEKEDMPRERQTLMFSATFPSAIQRLAGDFLKDYIFVTVGRVGSATDLITQKVEFVEEREKLNVVLDLLKNVAGLTLIFVETKRAADELEYRLSNEGFPATTIHGDRTQPEREHALRTFKSGKTPVMVATDVAARGLDVPNVMHVINYDFPNDIDDYTHRIGRTGRAGHSGLATTLINDRNSGRAIGELAEMLRENNQELPTWLEKMAQSAHFGSSGGGRGGRRGGGGGGGNRFGGRDARFDGGGGGGGGGGSYGGGGGGGSYGGGGGGSYGGSRGGGGFGGDRGGGGGGGGRSDDW